MARDFSNIEVDRVSAQIAEATQDRPLKKPRKSYTKEEARPYQEALQTSGRKGAGLPRINLAFTASNHEYITVVSRVLGVSMTEFINRIITQHREEHGELYKSAMELRELLDSPGEEHKE